MALPVCQVTATIRDAAGIPVVGAQVTARLSGAVAYMGLIVPTDDSGTTGATGQCTLALWPNSLSTADTTYSFEVLPPGAIWPLYFHNITIPNVASITLEELLGGVSGEFEVFYMAQGQSMAADFYMSSNSAPVSIHYMTGSQRVGGSLFIG